MKKILTLLCMLLTTALAHADFTPTTLFATTTDSCYRIPAIGRAQDGTLIAITDLRWGKGDIGAKKGIDLVYKTSTDGGKTWSDRAMMTNCTGKTAESTYVFEYAFGDAALVCDRESSKFLVMCAAGYHTYSGSYIATNTGLDYTKPIFVARITGTIENGKVTLDQEKPENKTQAIYDIYKCKKSIATTIDSCHISKAFFSSGRICQSSKVKVGDYYRLYAALTTNRGSLVVYSDDFGATWNALGAVTDQPSLVGEALGDEAKVEELPNGNVVLSCRARSGNVRVFNIFSYTTVPTTANTAEGSWGTAANLGVTASQTNGEFMIIPYNNYHLALLSVPASSSRSNVGIYWKKLYSAEDYDEVSDFTTASQWSLKAVSTTTSAYSTMVLNGSNLAYLYEENSANSGYDIQYLSISPDTITYDEWDGRIVMLKSNITTTSEKVSYYLRNLRDTNDSLLLKAVPVEDFEKSLAQDSAYSYYWIINKAPTDDVYYYISSYNGDGYLGWGPGYNWAKKEYTNRGCSMTDNYKDEFHVISFDKSGDNSSGKTAETMDGYALRFYDSSSQVKWIAISGSGDMNWMNYTTKGGGASATGTWSTDFDIIDITKAEDASKEETGTADKPEEYGWKTTFVRSDDSYTLHDDEDYNYYASLRLPFAVELPDNVKAFTCTEIQHEENKAVGLTELTDLGTNSDGHRVLPRETAVLLQLKHEDNDTDVKKIVYLRPQKPQTFTTQQNDFAGTLGKKTYSTDEYSPSSLTKRIYVLSKKKGRVAFYHLGTQTVPNNKAYFLYQGETNQAAAVRFLFHWDEWDDNEPTTPILPIAAPKLDSDAPIYDLTGRRVKHPTTKGIYLQNGRKFIIK